MLATGFNFIITFVSVFYKLYYNSGSGTLP